MKSQTNNLTMGSIYSRVSVGLTVCLLLGLGVNVRSHGAITCAGDVEPVTLTASVSTVPESGGTAELIFTLGGPVPPTLLTLQVSGTAVNGIDFATISNQVTIPGGQTRFTLPLVPITDALVEGAETVTVRITVTDNPCTFIASPNTVTLSIVETGPVDLPGSLDAANLIWSTGGNASWIAQTGVTHDGADAAQNGTISDLQESWLQTTVTGPARVSFWWRVSSEADFDWLRFHLDDVLQQQISGETGWQSRSFPVPEGSHTLRWRYVKDPNTSAGQDRGWVDQVTITPATGAPVIATQATAQTVWDGANIALSLVALGAAPLTYRWFSNDTNPIPAPGATLTISNVTRAMTGTYRVVVTNASGAVTSSPARLSITNYGGASSVLLFVDGTVPSPYEAALAQLGYSYQLFTYAPDLSQAVALANRSNTLVVIDATDNIHDLTNVRNFIAEGGRALVQAYVLAGDVNLAAALQVIVESRFTTPPPVHNWGGSPFFSGLSSPFSLTDLGFPENGQKFHVLAGGYGVAGFVSNSQPGEAGVVIGNSGRTIVNGFFLEDATSPADAVRFARNQIEFLINRPVPVHLVPISRVNGQFQIQLSGRAGQSCSVQSSGNLTQWTSVTNVTMPAVPMFISVPAPTDRSFYRVVSPPMP